MKYIYLAIAILLVIVGLVIMGQKAEAPTNELNVINGQNNTNMSDLTLTSNSFENNGVIPSKYTCDGENINPQLSIEGVPESAESLVLIMDDPDAIKPAGKVWDHWIVFNIPPTTESIPEGVEPEGIHGTGTANNTDYSGPCPPDAEHSYIFKLYALDTELDLGKGVSKSEVESAMEGHILRETRLIGRYERQ
ncbi:MAG: YbhB/YbcL family Raf kinase inhibitor-like protein [Candidatus Campbellbacteria bacterium]|nr:YbhB/YbcL family Raf kinase inhibitor-like protein [Candidatus Campbellbacteria bacterium]